MKRIQIFSNEQRKMIHKMTAPSGEPLSRFMLDIMALINSYKEGEKIIKTKFKKQTGLPIGRVDKLFTYLYNNRILSKNGLDSQWDIVRYVKTKFPLTEEIMQDAINKTDLPEYLPFTIEPSTAPVLTVEDLGFTPTIDGSIVTVRCKTRLVSDLRELAGVFGLTLCGGGGIMYAYRQSATPEDAWKLLNEIRHWITEC